jgi:hypothetical protein
MHALAHFRERHITGIQLISIALLAAPLLSLAGCVEFPTDAPTPPETNNPAPQSAGITIRVQMRGLDSPPALQLYVDNDASTLRQILPTDSLFIGVAPGEHFVTIAGLSPNCSADPGLQQRATVTRDGVATVRFDLTCVAVSGVVRATLSTGGEDTDHSGYTARLSNAVSFAVGANGVFFLSPVGAGTQTLTLGDISANCALNSSPSQSFSITVGGLKRDTADVAWHLTCTRLERIAFRRTLPDPKYPTVVFTANTDGSDVLWLRDGFAPSWSPDGGSLAFALIDCFYYSTCVRGGIAAVTLGGIHTFLTPDARDSDPAWRPTDGKVVAFIRNDSVYFVEAKNSGAITPLPTPAGIRRVEKPSWSPDATKIAVGCEMDDGRHEICVIDVAGSGFVRLTNNESDDTDPAWSPDGSRIAFTHGGSGTTSVAIMAGTGGEITSLTAGKNPAWSRDGSMLLFEAKPPAKGIFLLTLASGAIRQITAEDDHDPVWRP